MKFFYSLLLLFILSTFIVVDSERVFAQETSGVSVIPSILRLDLAEDPSGEFELIYKNNAKTEVVLEISATDFSELEDGWRVRFLSNEEAKNYQYSLASWIDFERKSVSLKPDEEGRLKVLINKDALSPGGHYASILASITGIEQDGKQVDVKGVLASLLFVRADTGQEIEQASISNLSVERPSLFHFPSHYILRFNNQGNTELVPFGRLDVKDPFGRAISRGILNEGSNYSLPETIKKFEIKNESNRFAYIPGMYSISLTVDYGKEGKKLQYDSHFLYVDWRILLTVFILVAICFASLKMLLTRLKRKKDH